MYGCILTLAILMYHLKISKKISSLMDSQADYQVGLSEVACLLAGHGREEIVGKAAGTDTEKILI